MNNQQPTWLDKTAYSFTSHFLKVSQGELHYVDEGKGEPILFVHGTPTWSFLWRNQIKEFSTQYRCIAFDHLGFGLSTKPSDFSYSLDAHQQNLALLVEHLQLDNVTLVMHDFGGPIGLGWALQNPDKVARLVIMNTWMWPLTHVKSMMQGSKFFGSSVGKFLYTTLNFSPRFLLPLAFFHKEKLTKEIHQHYLLPFADKKERLGPWNFAKALAGETTYFEELLKLKQSLTEKPTLILWGTKDKLIPASFLEIWKQTLPTAHVIEMETGHFQQEENPEIVTRVIKEFFQDTMKTQEPVL
ncbi:hypothetical protein DC20_18575 [Rufibacter tibetensis]|uniref:AB hydrolase-1 domain-containing protein n=2 Tax=Rufibacter tibetensis TaxID=512763 RepID=A0A0P0CSY7_9BACT|nr:hypothetical protein DC20_18575 [Rufibacter tibetensis]